MRTLLSAVLALLVPFLCAASLPAAEKTAADLLPASVVGYLEVAEAGKVVELVRSHPITAEAIKAPEYQKAIESNDYQRFAAALAQFEERLGRKWPEAIAGLTGGGLAVAFDLPTRGTVALAHATDEALAGKAQSTLVELAEKIARDQGRPGAVQKDEHRGTPVHTIGEASLAVIGRWVILSNKKPLVMSVIDAYHGEGETLAADSQFQTVSKARASATAWLYGDLRVLRLTGVLKNALAKKSDNPPVEVIAGGVIGALPDAPYFTATLDVAATQLRLTASLPCDPKTVAKAREFYLGADAAGVAPPLLKPPGTLLALSTYRDFASLWRHAPDLFDEAINARFAEAESGLKTIFAGRDFRDDILGNVEPGVQVVVARQEFPQEGITPAIKLPAAALVVRMKNPVQTARTFKVTFQSVVGFLNVAGAQNGIESLDLNIEKVGEALVVSGVYLPPGDAKTHGEAGLNYNASPTVAFVGDRFILASAKPLALELVQHVQHPAPAADSKANTLLQLDGQIGVRSLTENRGPLIAQNMLEKGHDRSAAETEIDRVLAAIRHFEGAALGLSVGNASLDLAVEMRLAAGK
jgi:hypothetical protein